MKPQRSYSDPEIARYVLGLDMAEQEQDIQALLAHDDTAAARALKWEAYFLSIVDALPAAPPAETLLPRIQQTLGMRVEAPPTTATILGEARERRATRKSSGQRADRWPGWLRTLPLPLLRLPRLRLRGRIAPKTLLWAAIGTVVVLGFAVLLVWASLRTTPQTVVHQSVPLQNLQTTRP